MQDEQPAGDSGELLEGVLDELEVEQAKVTLARHGIRAIAVGEQPRTIPAGATSPMHSKTSSKVLFGMGGDSETGIMRRNREQKQQDKLEARSVKSGESRWSINRSKKTGVYPCTAPNCIKMFTSA